MSGWGDALYACWRAGGNPDFLERDDYESAGGDEDPESYGEMMARRQCAPRDDE